MYYLSRRLGRRAAGELRSPRIGRTERKQHRHGRRQVSDSEGLLFHCTVSSQFRGPSWVPRWAVSLPEWPPVCAQLSEAVIPTLQWSRRNVMGLHRGHLCDPWHAYQWKPLRPRRTTVSLGSTDGQLTMSLCPPVAVIPAHQFTRTLQTHWVIIVHLSGPRERACKATL